MGIGFKIRTLLLLLSIGCIITVLSVSKTQTPSDILNREATILQNKLKQKEKIVDDFLNNLEKLEEAESFHENGEMALSFIKDYADLGINLFTYENKKLKFWSTIRVIPPNIESIKEGRSFLHLPNGYYEFIKLTKNHFTFLMLITVKNEFSLENQYLKNEITKDLSPNGLIEIASFNDSNDNLRNINGLEGKYLFSVKLLPYKSPDIYTGIEIWLWIASVLFLCMFFNSLSSWLAKRGHLFLGTLLLAGFFLLLRYTDLEYGWLNRRFDLPIFNPKIYAQSYWLPSLGDLLISTLAFTWFVLFLFINKKKYVLPDFIGKTKSLSILFQVFLLIAFGSFAYFVDDVFFGLIYNSKIPFDINVVNLDWVSWICVFLVCLAWFNFYLLAVFFVTLTYNFPLANSTRVKIFLISLVLFSIFRILVDFTAFYIVFALLMYLIGYNAYVQNRKFSVLIFAFSFFCMAFITSIKYIRYTDVRERNYRNTIVKRLVTADDPQLVNAISVFEQGVNTDETILDYFNNPGNAESFHNHIEKKYLNGILANFQLTIHIYNHLNEELGTHLQVPMQKFRDMVIYGALKIPVSNYFYRINDTFGYQSYFGVIPIFKDKSILGTIVVDLKSEPYNYNLRFPTLLIDGKLKTVNEYSNYSFAFYNNNKLVNQSGKYTYSLSNKDFQAPTGSLVYNNTKDNNINHLIYAPTDNKLIVISKDKVDYVTRFATLSFFFLILILFSLIVFILIWFLKNLENSAFNWFSVNKYLMINANQILYKTRIQVSIIMVVVATLIVVGWTTFYYISKEYKIQQSDQMQDKIRKLQISYEKLIAKKGIILNNDGIIEFDQFADVNGVYLNLYNRNGNLLLTSLPKIYDAGILSKRMDAKAYIFLENLQSSEFINLEEKVGDFQYASAYIPIRNLNDQTVAYLSSPFFNNEEDYNVKMDSFVNTLINIYALVFVIIGVLAVFLANQITSPLTFIQESIRKTKLGRRNQPIHWSRHDEIGSLIKEYNKMISALEESAMKLARSEREHAWREMAKQVAHEIKNPLTPLKLGVQLLERSWKEKDPNFEKKFENFNKSFIEQIDSLAKIASEFSSFAKMPDTKLEHVTLIPIIEKAGEVYKHLENAEIVIINKTEAEPVVLGDKDQLLRTFNNLLKNAIEAIPENRFAQIKIIIYENSNNVVVSVEDNGRGIAEEQKDQIFAPNFTTKSSGTGLGLAFVKQAVENAGGEVSFDSEEGEGTTFYLSFPLI